MTSRSRQLLACALLLIVATTMLMALNYAKLASSFEGRLRDRQSIVVPEVWVNSIESFDTLDDIVRNLLDVLWQSFDFEKCDGYDSAGKWLWGN